ncbi:MAG: hypothetical protein ABSE46_11105 [Terracidiphilus sp.]|jgi:hypothetical protein
MALISTSILMKAQPALHRFGYTTSDCMVLFAVADKEYGNAHIAIAKAISKGEEPLPSDIHRSYCTAGAKRIGFDVGVTTAAALLTLQKAERDGFLEVVRSGITNKVHLRKINAPALQCLAKYADFLRDRNKRTPRDAKKPKPTPLDFTRYVDGSELSQVDWEWMTDKFQIVQARSDVGDPEAGFSDFESVYLRDIAFMSLKGRFNSERDELIRGTYEMNKKVHNNRKGAKGVFKEMSIEVPCIRVRRPGCVPDPLNATEMIPFRDIKIRMPDNADAESDENGEWAKWEARAANEGEGVADAEETETVERGPRIMKEFTADELD